MFSKILQSNQISTDPEVLFKFGKDWLTDYTPAASCILFPETYQQVQEILQICSREEIKVVPSGGRTGLSGGATATQGEVVLSLQRLNRILSINQVERTVTCQAGVITEHLHNAVAEHSLYFSIEFASKGSSQIGGNIATNAGGIRVIRYGNIRDWVIGLKVVLADGELLDINGFLFKNQTGYDLRSLLIGSEGTLGVIVEATLKLTTTPQTLNYLMFGLSSLNQVLPLLQTTRDNLGIVSVFEYFERSTLELVLKTQRLPDPFLSPYPYYILVELENEITQQQLGLLDSHLKTGCFENLVVAENQAQAKQLLAMRELIPECLAKHSIVHKNDIAVPVTLIPKFILELRSTVNLVYPDYKVEIFGHIGDGNLHVNILKPAALDTKQFFDTCQVVDHNIFAVVKHYGGSISAEHGVGLLKKPYLSYSRTEREIILMKQIKHIFDPLNILNPGKIF